MSHKVMLLSFQKIKFLNIKSHCVTIIFIINHKFEQMETLVISIVLTISAINNVEVATDYCKLCTNHIACNNTGKFAFTCPTDAAIVK